MNQITIHNNNNNKINKRSVVGKKFKKFSFCIIKNRFFDSRNSQFKNPLKLKVLLKIVRFDFLNKKKIIRSNRDSQFKISIPTLNKKKKIYEIYDQKSSKKKKKNHIRENRCVIARTLFRWWGNGSTRWTSAPRS